MTNRIKLLRDASLNAVNCLSAERGLLVTAYYQGISPAQYSVPVERAKSFEYILQHKSICINEGELIVGERGPAPKSTPTYPEINLHSLKDLDILDSRKKVSFRVDSETRKAFEELIIPYWTGRTNRERIFSHLDEEWKDAYDSGVFTEFQEQRAPGHTVLGSKIYSKGMLDIVKEIGTALNGLDFLNDARAYDKREELLAMEITVRGIMGIQSGENPRVIQQKLTTFLPPSMRTESVEEAA